MQVQTYEILSFDLFGLDSRVLGHAGPHLVVFVTDDLGGRDTLVCGPWDLRPLHRTVGRNGSDL